MILKEEEHYKKLKKYFNTKHNEEWKSIAGRPFIGSCSYLFQKYHPKTSQEFLDKYLNDYDDTFNPLTCRGNQHCGRSIEQLNILAQKYFDLCNDKNVTLEDCFDDIVNHTIIETFDGHGVEVILSRMIEKTDPDLMVEGMVDDLDSIMGVDLVIRRKSTNKVEHFIQVKPLTTFLGNSNISLKKDRANFFNKQEKLNEYLLSQGRGDEIKYIEYVCYDGNAFKERKEVFLLTINNRRRLNLSELTNTDGTSKLNYNELKFSKLLYE